MINKTGNLLELALELTEVRRTETYYIKEKYMLIGYDSLLWGLLCYLTISRLPT